MKFTAIPVNEGDAFLLQYEEKSILVDTSKDKSQCRKFLQSKEITHLDLIVLTHYDTDHVNGVFEILDSEITIDEIWLPADFKGVSDYDIGFSMDSNSDYADTNNQLKDQIAENLRGKEDEIISIIKLKTSSIEGISKSISIYKEFERLSRDYDLPCGDLHFMCRHIFRHPPDWPFENGTNHCLKEIRKARSCLDKLEKLILNYQLIPFKYGNYHPLATKKTGNELEVTYVNKSHIKKIDRIIELTNLKDIKTTWIELAVGCSRKTINKEIPLYGLNCRSTVPKPIERQTNEDAPLHGPIVLALTRINIESFVFIFACDNLPNILYSADSGFSFISDKIELVTNSIITAPHHGSRDSENVKVYEKIKAINPIFVRSDSRNMVRPCKEFISQKRKYCTICNTSNEYQEVCLEYLDNDWKPTDNSIVECKRKTIALEKQRVA